MMVSKVAFVSIGALALGGCASTTAVRSLAQQDGIFVQSLSMGTADFLATENRLNAEGEARLRQLDADAAASSADARLLRLAWSDSGQVTRYQTLDRATAVSADIIVSGMQSQTAVPTTIAPVVGGYDASIKALAKASQKPKPLDQLGELVAFAQTVGTTFNDLQEKAKAAASAAGSAATTADANAQKATGAAVTN